MPKVRFIVVGLALALVGFLLAASSTAQGQSSSGSGIGVFVSVQSGPTGSTTSFDQGPGEYTVDVEVANFSHPYNTLYLCPSDQPLPSTGGNVAVFVHVRTWCEGVNGESTGSVLSFSALEADPDANPPVPARPDESVVTVNVPADGLVFVVHNAAAGTGEWASHALSVTSPNPTPVPPPTAAPTPYPTQTMSVTPSSVSSPGTHTFEISVAGFNYRPITLVVCRPGVAIPDEKPDDTTAFLEEYNCDTLDSGARTNNGAYTWAIVPARFPADGVTFLVFDSSVEAYTAQQEYCISRNPCVRGTRDITAFRFVGNNERAWQRIMLGEGPGPGGDTGDSGDTDDDREIPLPPPPVGPPPVGAGSQAPTASPTFAPPPSSGGSGDGTPAPQPTATATPAPTSNPQAERPYEEVVMRDDLVANQESLLNTYRCRFGVDVDAVPGGCVNGAPAFGATLPGVFPGIPTQADIDARDELVARQEALLNDYRCRFNVDTQLVPGGCVNGAPADNP